MSFGSLFDSLLENIKNFLVVSFVFIDRNWNFKIPLQKEFGLTASSVGCIILILILFDEKSRHKMEVSLLSLLELHDLKTDGLNSKKMLCNSIHRN